MAAKSSVEHVYRCLTKLRFSGKREFTETAWTGTSAVYGAELVAFDPRAVEAACHEWMFMKGWPELGQLVDAARRCEQELQPRQITRQSNGTGPGGERQALLAQAVNDAFSYLGNCHLREMARQGDLRRQEVAWETANWWLEHRPQFSRAQSQAEWRSCRDRVVAFVEGMLGRPGLQILDEENALHQATRPVAGGFRQAGAVA
jgi:hypothetical protein